MNDFVPGFETRDGDARSYGPSRLSTLGAVPVVNEQGKVVMQKVKVQRYVAGKVPNYAQDHSSSEDEERQERRRERREREEREKHRDDRHREDRDRDRRRRHDRDRPRSEEREIAEPEILQPDPVEEEANRMELEERRQRARMRRLELEKQKSDDEEKDDAGSDEEQFERRRRLLREKALQREQEEMRVKREIKEEFEQSEEEDDEETSDGDTSDDEEEEEDQVLRLKPVFVRKKDRITLTDAENEKRKLLELEREEQRIKEERRQESVRLAMQVRREEDEMEKRKKEDNIDLTSVLTDDESEEIAYEAWKLREMKRLKRNREEREIAAREKAELERIHGMNEEERKAWLRANPKIITNKQDKGKYKFLQKYFHRGVFFLDEEEDLKKQDFAQPTMEDQFDKTVLPKVMQVKNFGKASRTKWTHLTAEDTTDHQGAWNTPTAQNVAFYNKKAGGTRAVFDRPAAKKRKV